MKNLIINNKGKVILFMAIFLVVVAVCISVCCIVNNNSLIDNVSSADEISTVDEISTIDETVVDLTTNLEIEATTVTATALETASETSDNNNNNYNDTDVYESTVYIPSSDGTTVNLGQFTLTAYCPCYDCNGPWAYGPTATGTMPQAGRTIAVDPNVIPYGTRVLINGNVYVAEDCGGAIVGNRIDVYFSTHSECMNFGVQTATVEIFT